MKKRSDDARTWSNRRRVTAPLTTAGAFALRGLPALAQNATAEPVPAGPLGAMLRLLPPSVAGAVVFELLMAEPGGAERAKPVVEQRLAGYRSLVSNQPLSDLFAAWDVWVDAERNVLEIDFSPNPTTPLSVWSRMIYSRDDGFIAW